MISNSYLIGQLFQGYRCESDVVIFAWKLRLQPLICLKNINFLTLNKNLFKGLFIKTIKRFVFSFSRRVWIGLDPGSWSYELNPRLSESSLVHRIEKNGELFLEPTSSCAGYPETTYINAWSLNPSCSGLVYLTYPVQITNSSCPLVNSGRGVNYYGLVCSDDRTNWCQREYKDDLIWPKEIGRTCGIQRTGVDKSRCYSDGRIHNFKSN